MPRLTLDNDLLRRTRLEKGLSVVDLARKAHISVASLRAFESERGRGVRVDNVHALAKALGLKYSDLAVVVEKAEV